MKRADLSKMVGVSVLTLSTAILPLSLPASAQTTTTPDTGTQTTQPGVTYETRDDGFDWGWLGLLGLAGLFGLAGRKREEPARYRDPNATTTTGYRD